MGLVMVEHAIMETAKHVLNALQKQKLHVLYVHVHVHRI